MIPRNYVPKPFPSYRYHAVFGAKRVETAEDALQLGDDWSDCPGGSKIAPHEPPPVPPEMAIDDAAMAAELYATPAAHVIARVQTSTSPERLEHSRSLEMANTSYKGGRKSVLAAIDGRIALLRSQA